MRIAIPVIVALAMAGPALAQRPAISPALSPEAAGAAFEDAVVNVCVPAVTGNGVGGLSAAAKARISPTNDVETRQQAGATPDETVWDIVAAKGVVTIREKGKHCLVSAYGPPARATIASVARTLTGPPGFQNLAQPVQQPDGIGQRLYFSSNGRAVIVMLDGSEPGMPGHRSRFSVITATVFIAS